MSNILHFKDDYPAATSLVLTENYRSLQGILDKAYNFIQANNPNRLEYTLQIPKKLKALRQGMAVMAHLHAPSLAEETQLIADTILKLRRSDPTLAFRDIAVLARANSHIEAVLPTLDRVGIPYQFSASSGLYAKPVILDVVAYLKLLDNYHESAALYRVLVMPFLGMPYEDIALLTHYAKRKGISLYVALKASALTGVSAEAQKIADVILHHIWPAAQGLSSSPNLWTQIQNVHLLGGDANWIEQRETSPNDPNPCSLTDLGNA
jgi:DNA helicase-2/ATP-dependent DNA helicase PcrA